MKCPTCDQEVPRSKRLASSYDSHLTAHWDYWTWQRKTITTVEPDTLVELVARSDIREYESYQGDSDEIWMVFKTVDGAFLKKSGTCDSYGSTDWNGPLEYVHPTMKTVTVYDI